MLGGLGVEREVVREEDGKGIRERVLIGGDNVDG